ncbi:MAG: SWIM zinc finger family protein [Defluviitaleaceae bacterium]|nr:SWIM zinc finger family protein [Defluviitaleaceae bacterium]
MTLLNFENYIDSKILSRGKEYYQAGYVASLEYDGDEWVANVEGSEEYTVSVSLSSDGEITDTYCDCPYEWGDYCKHQVAVFYEIRDKGQKILAGIKSNKPAKREKLENILAKLDKEALIALIVEYAGTYKQIKSEIQFRFSEKEDVTNSARQVIRSAINAVKHRGYVEYRDVGAATDGAEIVIQMMDDKIAHGDISTGVSLGVVVAEEMMDLIAYCDDSNGYVGGAISTVISKIQDAILAMPINCRDSKKIFQTILSHALDDIYDGWTEWPMAFFSALVPLCNDRNNREQLERYLSVSDSGGSRDLSRDFDYRHKQWLRLQIIKQFDGDEAARNYIEQNLDNYDFRIITIKFAIAEGDYDKAVALCIEGESDYSQSRGYVKQLRELRYTAYEAAGKIPELKSLALTLLLDGDFAYFLKYKDLHTKEDWLPAYYDVLDKTEGNNIHGIYVEIITHEKHKPRILAYCKKSQYAIVRLHTYLLPEYKQEVGEIFTEYIRAQATRADNRSRYHEICKLIETWEKACPGGTVLLCDEIREKYAHRPAFMDEMRKMDVENG